MGYKIKSKTPGQISYKGSAPFRKKAEAAKLKAWSGSLPTKTNYGIPDSSATKAAKLSETMAFPISLPSSFDQQEAEAGLARQLVDELAETNSDVNTLCETYQLRREELGRLTGFSLRALAEWAAGKLPSQPAKRRLQEVRRLLDALAEIVKRESISKWLHQPNPAFGRLTPLQVIELGEIDRLWAMVHELGSGQPD